MVLNGLMVIVMGVTFVFCIGDIDSVLDSPTNQPFIQVFYNATQSNAGATVMASIIVIMMVCLPRATVEDGIHADCCRRRPASAR